MLFIKLKSSESVQGWYMKDDFIALLEVEQLCCAVILGLKWSKMKFVYLLRPSTISVMYTTSISHGCLTASR